MLPETIEGKWIWLQTAREAKETYLYFRRSFVLDESPAEADLWITARTGFQVYVNGRLLGYGPAPSSNSNSCVTYLDANYLLQAGRNVIAVLAHNTSVTRGEALRQEGGLWCQLNIDGSPAYWTDEKWLCAEADVYDANQPRRSQDTGFCEMVDLGMGRVDWQSEEFDDDDWQTPGTIYDIGVGGAGLVPSPQSEFTCDMHEFKAIAAKGSVTAAASHTEFTFSHLARNHGEGIYAARFFFRADKTLTTQVQVHCDEPCRAFLNGEEVVARGLPELKSGLDPLHTPPLPYMQSARGEQEATITVNEGWNEVLFYSHATPYSSSISFVVPDLPPRKITTKQEPLSDAANGIVMAGPLKAGLCSVSPVIDVEMTQHYMYVPLNTKPTDETALLCASRFSQAVQTKSAQYPLTLNPGQFMVFDLGATWTGCPEIVLEGSQGDVVDIVCGEQMVDGHVPPYAEGVRNVDAVVLRGGENRWMPVLPRGLRYLMVLARLSEEGIRINSLNLCYPKYEYPNRGAFKCSDGTLHEIWQTSQRTLEATVQGCFLDGAVSSRTEHLANAMVQSFAAYHVLGCYDEVASNIQQFAAAQYESGEMPAAIHTNRYINQPAFSLLWPVWLQRHYLYTGDSKFLKSMMPNLKLFFRHYDYLSGPDSDVLHDFERSYGSDCVLDRVPIDARGTVTAINALYCRSLLSGAWLCEEARMTETARMLRERATRISREVFELAWDREAGMFADCVQDGEMSDKHSWQTNVLALYGGIVPSKKYEELWDKLFMDEAPFIREDSGEMDNPFFRYFVLETAFALEKRQWAVDMTRWYWGSMVERGAATWWELFNPLTDTPPGLDCSLCHGYGTHPAAYLSSELAGIRPAVPGFKTAVFDPILTTDVDYVKAQIPTVHGSISVEWRREEKGLQVAIDASYPLELVPVLDPQIMEDATFHVSDDVTILAGDEFEPESDAQNTGD